MASRSSSRAKGQAVACRRRRRLRRAGGADIAQLGHPRAARDAGRDRPLTCPADHRLPHRPRGIPARSPSSIRSRASALRGLAALHGHVTCDRRSAGGSHPAGGAAVIGLTAAAFGRPLWAALAVLAGRGVAVRTACAAVAIGAVLLGAGRVDHLQRRSLRAGGFSGVVTVATQPGAGRGPWRRSGGGGDGGAGVAVRAARAGRGAIACRAVCAPIDAVVAGYYATQGAHLELGAERVPGDRTPRRVVGSGGRSCTGTLWRCWNAAAARRRAAA